MCVCVCMPEPEGGGSGVRGKPIRDIINANLKKI